jgi:hypothetical protein
VSEATTKFGREFHLILQMALEIAEYEILKYVNPQDLLCLRILTIEFHDMKLWIQNTFYLRFLFPAFSKLFEHFDVVNPRAHNSSHTFCFKGFFMPSALELKFHRKDSLLSQMGRRQLPSLLDFFDPL